jgi:3-oxoacyl-(acyl-carrier-protein) synthase
MAVVVTGIGVVSALGPNTQAFRRALISGDNVCRPHQFKRLDGSVVTAPAYMAVPAEPEGLIEPRRLRRMFRLARMSAVAARQALRHAELDPASMEPSRLGVVFGTSFGAMDVTQKFVDSWLEQGEQHASPLQFMNSVHGILASQIALDVNATGVNLTTAQRDICFEAALDTAVGLLEARRADVILVGGADEITDLLHEFGSQTHQVSLDLSARGIDPWASRAAVIPGDGAAVAVLERDDTPRRALARVSATGVGRHDTGGADVARSVLQACGNPPIDLVTNTRDGGARSNRVCNAREATLKELTGAPAVSHRGSLGTYPAAGAQQFAANVLMVRNREAYQPLANGEPHQKIATPPKTILHDAASISGSHAAYVIAV